MTNPSDPDPEVSTLSTLTNVQNSLFIPDLGNLLNRMPTYTLTRRPADIPEGETPGKMPVKESIEEEVADKDKLEPAPPRPLTVSPVSSLPEGDGCFAILPEGVTLDGWSQQDVEELNDHVRHMLHSRRSKFKRAMRGFGQYVRKRKGPAYVVVLRRKANGFSTWIFCHLVCHFDHSIWSCLGSFLDWYVHLV